MPETPGLSFSPLGSPQSKHGTDETPAPPIQEAIRVLSLRIPKIAGGAPSLAPYSLLTGAGSGGVGMGGGTNLGLEDLLRKLFGITGPGAGGMAPSAPGAPSGGGSGSAAPPAFGGGGGSAPPPHFVPIGPTNPPPLDPDPNPPIDLSGIPGWPGSPGGWNPGGTTF